MYKQSPDTSSDRKYGARRESKTVQTDRGLLFTSRGVRSLDVGLDPATSDPVEELFPTVERLPGPDPEGRGDPDDQAHQVLYHEQLQQKDNPSC